MILRPFASPLNLSGYNGYLEVLAETLREIFRRAEGIRARGQDSEKPEPLKRPLDFGNNFISNR